MTLKRRGSDAPPNVVYAREVEPLLNEREAAEEEVRELLSLAEQLEGLNVIAERVDTLNATATRIAVALEELVKQHHAAASAEHGPLFHTLLSEQEPA